MHRILIIEDDSLLRAGLKKILEMDAEYLVCAAESCEAARNRDFSRQDLFILDIGLPDGDGIALCREIRAVTGRPILMLTAYDAEEKVLQAFREGADDYVIKPFRIAELKARIQALLRRSRNIGRPTAWRSGELRVSADACEAFFGENPVSKMNRMEISLLQVLMRHHGKLVSRESVGQALWFGEHENIEDNTLSVTVSRLRKKLEKMGLAHAIETCWGSGYRWCLPVEDLYEQQTD